MVRQLGTPTWFFTVSAADLKWPDMIRVIARQFGKFYKTDEEIEQLAFEERCNWIRRNPVAAARHFHYRLNCLFTDSFKSDAQPLGELQDYAIRIEFQLRGSPHAHCILWMKDSPKFGIDPDRKVCEYIDRYISCELPSEEGLLKNLVSLLQMHRHSTYCKKTGKCRFKFPHPPSTQTLIAQCPDNDDTEDVTKRLGSVRK